MTRFRDLKIGSRLIALVAVFLMGFSWFGVYTLGALNTVKVNGPIYVQIVKSKDLIADILPPPMYIIESYLNALEMVIATENRAPKETIEKLADKAGLLRNQYEKHRTIWQKNLPEGPLKQMLLESSYGPAREFYAARDIDFIPAILAGDLEKSKTLIRTVLNPKYEAHRASIDQVVILAIERARQHEEAATKTIARTVLGFFGIGFSAATISLLFSIFLGRSITVPLTRITAVATEMARGNLDFSALGKIRSHDETGVLAYAFVLMADQLRHTLGELLKSNDELEKRVLERTRDLEQSNIQLQVEVGERKRAEAVLNDRTKELERSNSELGMFAYVASHDLQEPLRMVVSYLQLIEMRYKEKLDTDGREFIGYVVDGAKRMQVLINDLLVYSRIGTKGQPFQPIDCELVLQRAIRNLQVAIRESGAQISHDPLPTVMGDATQLEQLFQNLIGNALKFRREIPPRVHISAEHKDGTWTLSVHDNGIGIEPQHFNRIFVVFQRLHSQSNYSGTGIGLAICKKIAERHNGAIWVESELGKGATFHFSIPEKTTETQ